MIQCNNCMKTFEDESKLELFKEENEFFKGCQNCKTDAYLMDLEDAKRLDNETWKNIFKSLQEMSEDDYYDGVVDWVEVIWLETNDEWCLCFGTELFEDGFKTKKEAQDRLKHLERELL